MWPGSRRRASRRREAGDPRSVWVFLLRHALLYFLLLHAYFYVRGDLSLTFLSAGFAGAAALAVGLERLRLRLWVALPVFQAVSLGVRLLSFLVFRLRGNLAPGPDSDFLFFLFDRTFVPSLAAWTLVFLLDFLALRHRGFVRYEAAILGLLLAAVFWAQGRYRVTLHGHPTTLAYLLLAFLLVQLLVLILVRPGEQLSGGGAGGPAGSGGAGGPAGGEVQARLRWRRELAALGSFGWLAVPVLLLLLLFVLGRFSEGAVRVGGGLMKPTLFRFDFSEYVRLQSEIEMSDDLVLLFRKQGPAERILLRRYILSGYERTRGFFHVPDRDPEALPVTVPDAPEEFPDPGYAARSPVGQEYFFVNFDPSSLIGMNRPVRVAPLANWEASSFQRIYRVQSLVSVASAGELGRAGGRPLEARALRHHTDFGGDPRLRALAEEITADIPGWDAYARVIAIRDYLKHGYYYSLRPGMAADGDQLSHFLFESQKGYCSYFAFSMALLCRSLGIPARVAVGFYVHPEAEVLNFYEVRAHQAHAWVEVYFGEYGWIDFDPSSEQIAPGEEYTLQFGFEIERFARLLEEILRNQNRLRETGSAAAQPREHLGLWSAELAQALLRLARLSWLILPGVYLLVVSLLRGLPYLLVVLDRDPRRQVRRRFAVSLRALRGLGLPRRAEESWLEFAERLEGERQLEARPWVESFLQAVFAPTLGAEDCALARERHRSFHRSLRARYAVLRRLLGWFNPRGVRPWSP